MLNKIYNPNKTLRRVSYKELKAQHERNMRRSDRFFSAILIATLSALALAYIAQLVMG